MSEVGPRSQSLPTPPAPPRAIEPRQAKPMVEGDRAAFASGPAAWVHATSPRVEHAAKDELKRIAGQALELLKTPDLSSEDQAALYFLASGAHGRLSDMEDQTGNGKLAYGEIAKAARLAPARLDIVSGYAEAVNELVKRGGFTRGFAENILGVKTTPEATQAVSLLARFPGDARAQAFRLKFASFLKDGAAVQQARQALAALPTDQVAAACKAVEVKL